MNAQAIALSHVRPIPAAAPRAGALSGVDASHDFELALDDRAPAAIVRKSKVPKAEIADMTAQLAIMTQSGLDLSSALNSLAAQCERPALAEVLRDVNELVHGGNTLSESLKTYPDVFDGAYVATVAAAEASGRMAEVLKQLAAMQRSELRLRQSIKALLTYPILLTAIAGTVISILVVFVLPRFADIFAQYEVDLPMVTQILLAIATEAKVRWWLWAPAVGAAVAGAVAWRMTENGRRIIDRWMLKAPTVGGVARPLFTGRLCTLLGLLLNSGVPLLDGLRLCRQAASNCVFKDLIGELADSVLNGRGMGAALLNAEAVPTSAREMIITGERTGKLAEVAQLLGVHYEEEAENRMKQVVRVLEPLITVVMGAVVAVVVLAVMLPIFDLSSVGH
ncbi:MAG: type II secretion system F family protein [Pirellulales bacterium]|nr:type II secretion system F family protein [Pirellulales bacterium]